jgi:hypothetical protein
MSATRCESPPRKEKPGAGKQTGRIFTERLRISYRVLHLLQAPFGFVFWRVEQVKARIQDLIDNTEVAQ